VSLMTERLLNSSSAHYASTEPVDPLEEEMSIKDYPEQDTRSTSTKELFGWYFYCFAAEVYAVVSLGNPSGFRVDVGTYIPITLEQLASEKGVLNSDKTTPCIPLAPSISGLSPRFEDGDRCVFRMFGRWIDTASFALYVFSISVLLQALVVISMSGAADHGIFFQGRL
jgi:MFS transporter, UMF1 family